MKITPEKFSWLTGYGNRNKPADGVKFWMDRSRHHDVDDAWGFLRVEPMPGGRSLVSYGVLIACIAGFGVSLLGRLFAKIYSKSLDRAIPLLVQEMNASRV